MAAPSAPADRYSAFSGPMPAFSSRLVTRPCRSTSCMASCCRWFSVCNGGEAGFLHGIKRLRFSVPAGHHAPLVFSLLVSNRHVHWLAESSVRSGASSKRLVQNAFDSVLQGRCARSWFEHSPSPRTNPSAARVADRLPMSGPCNLLLPVRLPQCVHWGYLAP